MRKTSQPWHWLFWHPHQGLGNAKLLRQIGRRLRPEGIARRITRLVVHADTAILTLRAVWRRLLAAGPLRIFSRARLSAEVEILHLDLGTHVEGAELFLLAQQLQRICGARFRAYGFEASRNSFDRVAAKAASYPTVTIVHAALCHNVPETGVVTLYKAGDSLSDSLYRKSDVYEEVCAIRLSEFLSEHEPHLKEKIVLLRMNIEGAELDVIRDLAESGIAKHIDGYFGMWDDLSKIDLERDRELRRILADRGIEKCTFNGRDLGWPSRIRFIAYEVETAIMKGCRRLRTDGRP